MIWAGLLLIGLVGGLLVGYLADTLPRSFRLGRLACHNCGQPIPWGRFLLFRRCGNCGAARNRRALVLLAAIPLAVLFLGAFHPHQLELPLAVVVLLYLVLIAAIDIEHRVILSVTSVFGAVLGLAVGSHLHGIGATLLGGAVGYCAMLALYFFGGVFVRYVSRRRGEAIDEVALGFGDVTLAGIAGLFLGWPGIAFGLIFTVLAGGVFSLLFIAVMALQHRYRAYTAIAYGPFLALSVAVLLLRP